MDAFLAGEPQLLPFEVDELGPLEGRLLHLQSGSGLDSLDIARLHPTVCVTGLDDAPHEVEAATQLASEVRLAHRARFVYAGLFHAIDVLEHQRFDVIYTGKGASTGYSTSTDGPASCTTLSSRAASCIAPNSTRSPARSNPPSARSSAPYCALASPSSYSTSGSSGPSAPGGPSTGDPCQSGTR